MAIFVDGQQVGAAHDQRITDGYVGFTVAAPAQATFSNLFARRAAMKPPIRSGFVSRITIASGQKPYA